MPMWHGYAREHENLHATRLLELQLTYSVEELSQSIAHLQLKPIGMRCNEPAARNLKTPDASRMKMKSTSRRYGLTATTAVYAQ